MNNFIFLNHASFAIEREREILLVDPWYEGNAFNNSWALLDTKSSNESVIKWLTTSNKKIYIWYSHEHSDHLSISFLKSLAKENIDLSVIFQQTLDGRVSAFLKRQNFKIFEAIEGKSIELGENLSITTWPYRGGDSYCLINSNSKFLLNINDCVISNIKDAIKVKRNILELTENVHILLTQFGYANWAGNEGDVKERVALSEQKLDRILTQDKIINPLTIIPFASFVYFCNQENFYLNDAQNDPISVKSAVQLDSIQNKIYFMKPWDLILLEGVSPITTQLEDLSTRAIPYWMTLKKKASPLLFEAKAYSEAEMMKCFLDYRKTIAINFLLLPQLFELLKIIPEINVLLTDINRVAKLSYFKGITFEENVNQWHISLSSELFHYIFVNDYGFNSVHVGGRFRLGEGKRIFDVIKFFIIQDYYKNGFGVRRPIASMRFLLAEAIRFIGKKYNLLNK